MRNLYIYLECFTVISICSYNYLLIKTVAGVLDGDVTDDGSEDDESEPSSQDTLYKPDDPVLQLNKTNFDSSVYGVRKSFLIEFYSSWCGHCINFAPIYSRFAKDVAGWNTVVTIGCVNCALSANSHVCRKHKINSYPTLVYFPYKTTSPSNGTKFKRHGSALDSMRHELADFVVWDSENHMPSGWPDFSLVKTSLSIQDLWSAADSRSATYMALIVGDEKNNRTAVEVMLDFSSDSSVYIRYISSNHSIAHQHGIKLIPGLLLFQNHQLVPSYVSKIFMQRRDIIDMIKKQFNVKGPPEFRTYRISEASSPAAVPESTNPDVHMSDLLSGLGYLLTHEVAGRHTIRGAAFHALTKYLDVLIKYFPGRPNVTRFLSDIREWLDKRGGSSGSVDGELWAAHVEDAMEKYDNPIPKKPRWIACKGSQPRFRGYPCSLWLIFHALTVSAYQRDGSLPDFKPDYVLEASRDYILSFFGCAMCAKNFAKEAANLDHEVLKPKDAVLWLWRTHNRVNKRLHGDASEDPTHPKAEFPSQTLCPDCRGPRGVWRNDAVFHFLLDHYNLASSTRDDNSKRSKLVTGNEIDPGRHASGGRTVGSQLAYRGFFSKWDVSICFVIWCGSVILLGFLYLVVMHRRGRLKQIWYTKLRQAGYSKHI